MAFFFMKRRPIWKALLVVATALAIVGVSVAFWIRSLADRKVAAMEEKLRDMDAKLLAPDLTPRPGKVSGNCWDDYLPALAAAGKIRQSEKLIGLLQETRNADVDFGRQALAAHGSIVDLIVSGARRGSCVPPGSSVLPALWKWETATHLAILKARALREEGKTAEAVEILLALCQFGRDLSETGLPYSTGLPYPAMEFALKELKEVVRGPMPADSISDLDLKLAFLDEQYPDPAKVRTHLARIVAETHSYRGTGIRGATASWRFGGSTRLMSATIFERWSDWMDRSAVADRLPWLQAKALISTLRDEIARTRFVGPGYDLTPFFLPDGDHARAARAHLRLLRIAAHVRRTGEILDLDDPFGTKLLHQEGGGRLKIWSVGKDGVDQQGLGSWEAQLVDDIVLEVPR